MVYGILRLINFAHGEVFMVGAFAGLMTQQRSFDNHGGVVVLVVSLLVPGVAGALCAWLIERIAYRPLRGRPRIIALIGAIGVSSLLQSVVSIATKAAPFFWRPVFVTADETALYVIEP